ncbi:MAG: retention module-containing protein, partial [Luminiphilus sp.]
MAEASGIVSTLVGRAIARSPDGSERELRVGDAVRPDDVIITAEGAFLEIDMPDAPSVVVSERLEFAFTEELFDQGFSETESSVDDNTVDAILAALESGGDLLEELEAPAAGAGGAAGNQG